jgi:hypothetical protein
MSCFDYTPDRWDRERDERKHEPMTRLDPAPLDLAVECAIAVRNCPNIHAAAGLIEAYCEAKNAAERLDAVAAGAGR